VFLPALVVYNIDMQVPEKLVFTCLRTKGFAVKYVKKTLRIYPKTCEDLMVTYGEQFKRLELWLDELQEKELDIFSKTLDGFEPSAQA
jgi:hypothetical protein